LARGVDVIVGCPGRLIDIHDKGMVTFENLRTLILDEADEMLRMGFDKDVEMIYGKIMDDRHNNKTQNLLYSATFPPWIRNLAMKYLDKDFVNIDLLKGQQLKTPATV